MLTQDLLKQQLHYDSESGVFTRLINSAKSVVVGDIAGCTKNDSGYVIISVLGKLYRAHRLAWLYSYGVWPKHNIDHINGIRNDNRLCNLREATHAENSQNLKNARSHSKSGILGVSYDKTRNKWRARIVINGVEKHLGRFPTIEEAQEAYVNAKRLLHPFSLDIGIK